MKDKTKASSAFLEKEGASISVRRSYIASTK